MIKSKFCNFPQKAVLAHRSRISNLFVWRPVSSNSSCLQDIPLAQGSLYGHKGGLKPHSFLSFELAHVAWYQDCSDLLHQWNVSDADTVSDAVWAKIIPNKHETFTQCCINVIIPPGFLFLLNDRSISSSSNQCVPIPSKRDPMLF